MRQLFNYVFLVVCLVLFTAVFLQIRRLRKAVNDVRGLYGVMLSHVLGEVGGDDEATDDSLSGGTGRRMMSVSDFLARTIWKPLS
jgi:hypothetical protein